MEGKRVSDSKAEQVQILLAGTLNGSGRLYGGQLMAWIDIVAAVVARRHSGRNVTTAFVDSLRFEEPARLNDTVVLKGHLTYVGRTSMEVCVQSFVEDLSGERRLINKAYLIMVALDENELPVEVPPLIVETEEERAEFEAGAKRRALRHSRKSENY
ncbi:MAG TPA: acyl-CoA thioesterase [Clostridia bacterium]|nr:acyl-CoA thioesterase [Clostridia bacterium]